MTDRKEVLLDEKITGIGGYSYEVVMTRGQPTSIHTEEVAPDPNAVYLDIWVIDELNDITHYHQCVELSKYCKVLK
jgi:hypothetical protein